MVDKTALAELLAYDIPVTQVAQAFGVSSQYIQALMKDDEELQSILADKATEVAVREHNSRVNVEVIKNKLLEKIIVQIDLSDSLMESTKALQTVVDIESKQRALTHGQQSEGAKPGRLDFNLNLPEGATFEIQKSGTNEIISIAGRNMAPMPANKVIETVKERNENGKGRESDSGQSSDEHGTTYTTEYAHSPI